MSRLLPCSSCDRHVRLGEASCPFCGAPVPTEAPAPRVPLARLGRAATLAFATSVAAAGCGDTHSPQPDAGSIVPAYGVPPIDAGIEDSGPGEDAGTDAATPTADAGTDGGGIAPAYGVPPADSGVQQDGGGVAPLYGAPSD